MILAVMATILAIVLRSLINSGFEPAPNVSGFIAQLVRASQRYHEVTGSNPVAVGSWSFADSNFPVRNQPMNEMIYEMNHILNC